MVTILVHYCPFWSIFIMSDPTTPPWPFLTSIPFQVVIQSRNGSTSHWKRIQSTFACACCGDHLDQFWSILVHFGAPHGCPHHPSMTGSDSYPLSSVHLIQKWIILVIEDKFEKLFLGHAIVTILVHFGQFWCTSWVTPRPLFIEFPSSHQRYVSYA